MKQDIIQIVVSLGVLAFVSIFLAGAVLTLLAQQFDDELWEG